MAVKLNYNISGNGELVVVLHGLFGSSRNWQTMAKQLATDFQVMTVDLRNHGNSQHAPEMNYPEMADDVHQLIAEHTSEPVTLVGHSMGGKVAMYQSLISPHTVSKLLVLDIAPIEYYHRYGKLFNAMQNLPLDTIKNRNEAEALFSREIDDPLLYRFLLQNLARSESGFYWKINLPVLQENIETINHFPDIEAGTTFDQPSLFLGGARSEFITPDSHAKIFSLFPNARIDLIENAGHMLHVEESGTVLEKIREFISTTDA